MEANPATLEGLDITGPKEQIRACNNVLCGLTGWSARAYSTSWESQWIFGNLF